MRALRPTALLIDARGRSPLCTPPWVGLPGPHPGNLCGTVVPAPTCGRSTPRPGLLSRVEKVGKDTPRAVPFGIPRCRGAALFALAYASRRATSCHYPRRICHFGWWVNRSFFLPKLHRGSHLQLLIRGAAVRFSFWVLPGVAALSGGSGEAAGGMIMPPTGVQGASPLTRLW